MIISVDIGTSSVKIKVYGEDFKPEYSIQKTIKTYYPKPGWSEQDPNEIYFAVKYLLKKIFEKYSETLAGIGITNQRATTVMWNRETGEPIYNAITWMDTRGSEVREKLREELGEVFNEIEIFLNPNASSMHIKWILDNISGIHDKAKSGKVIFGNLNTYIIWRLTNGEIFATDPTNAIATGLFDPFSCSWADYILDILKIPYEIFPEIKDNADEYGVTKDLENKIPIYASIGDQQAALVGEGCINIGQCKVTHGTGSFIDVNVGEEILFSETGLLPLIAWRLNNKTTYMLEGYIRNTGDAVDWLIKLGILDDYKNLDNLATSINSCEGVYFIPALSGLGAPYWDEDARGLIIGFTHKTRREHIVRSVLESIAYLTYEILDAASKDLNIKIDELRIDGGLSESNFLCQFTSDLLQIEVKRQIERDISALGVAFISGIKLGLIKDINEISEKIKFEKIFRPEISSSERDKLVDNWRSAVKRALGWRSSINV